jgi:hypothetical protein
VRLLKAISFLLLLLPMLGRAESVDPDLKKLIRQAEQPKMQYGPARVGWNGPDKLEASAAANPVYESLRADSPAAIRAELKSILIPDWHVLLALLALIFGIRMMRSSLSPAETETEKVSNVVPFPRPSLPHEEAA